MNSTINDLMMRRSIRKYKPECPSKELLDQIIAAGTCAPSGMNWQSAIIVCVTDKKEIEYLSKLNAHVRGADGTDPYYDAPAALLVLAKKSSPYALQDGSLVMGNMMNAAYALGLGSCWINKLMEVMETEDGKALLKKWGIEGEYMGIGSCIVGYPDEERQMKPRKENYVYYVG